MTLEDRAPEHQESVKTATRLSAAALVVAAAVQEEATQAADQAVLADQTVQADQAHQAHRADLVVEAVAQEVKILQRMTQFDLCSKSNLSSFSAIQMLSHL